MLFIHGTLQMGGVETFFVRMAKERHAKGLYTSILLLKPEKFQNSELINEMRLYATIYYLSDFFRNLPGLTHQFILLAPAKKNKIKQAVIGIDQIHTYGAMSALLGQRMLKISNETVPITIGFYHYLAYLWGEEKLAHNIKVDREFVFNYLPREALLFFSEGNRDLHSKNLESNFEKSKIFRLGVVDKKQAIIDGKLKQPINITTVGRLVEFKTYNIFMLDVIKKLSDEGYNIRFNIYGDGPLYESMIEKIKELNLETVVILHGTMNYRDFDAIVSQADLFIGSGTAIVQASSLGVASIVGVENMLQPKTYGYFSEVHRYEYNMKSLNLPLIEIKEIIKSYINLNDLERLDLKQAHIDSIDSFTNESCQDSINQLQFIKMPESYFKFNPLVYEISRFVDLIHIKINRNHPFNLRHKLLLSK